MSVKDAQGDPAYGRTHWRRFAIAVGVPTVVAGVLVTGVASGALAASFSVSGTQFKLSATKLEGNGFTQYSGLLKTDEKNTKTGGKPVPAAKSGIGEAWITDLCQTVAVGPVVLRIEAGTNGSKDPDRRVHAKDLLIGMSELSGDATFTGIDIGQDASTLNKDGAAEHGEVGGFGQQADKVTIDNLHQVAYSTSASTFELKDMSLKLLIGGKECF